MKITHVHAREVIDSRGNPTVAARLTIDNQFSAEAMVPSGASTGVHEAIELRDGDADRYNGKGVMRACENVRTIIAPRIIGMDPLDQRALDTVLIELDGTQNKSSLGANAILAVSLANARAVAVAQGIPVYQSLQQSYHLDLEKSSMPFPMMNIINGGAHANNTLDVQECMIVPKQSSFKERLRCGAEVFYALKTVLEEKGEPTSVGDEGGFAPNVASNEDALRLIEEAISRTQYTFGKDVFIALDVAASEFYKNGKYLFDGKECSATEMVEIFEKWVKQYHIISIEDGCAEDDWDGWRLLTEKFGNSIHIVGDDLFVTNKKRLEQGIEMNVGNAILIKFNQIGTVTETIETIDLAQKNGYTIIISHRSGETEDTTIADLAVATSAEYIKTGSLSRSERIAKYNRLLDIEEHNSISQ